MPYIGTSPSNGVRRVHTYTATASQTTFTGASSEGVTLSYVDTNYIDVFQNGVLLGSADYTSTSGTSVVLAQGASVDDLIVIVVYDVFSVADTVSKTNGGSFDSGVTMSSTLDVTGALSAKGGAVFNEDSADVDFRVESNGNANMLFVDGGTDAVIIGHNASRQTLFNTTGTAALQIEGTSANTAAMSIARNSNDDNGPQLVLAKSNGTSGAAVTVVTDDALLGRISFQGADGSQTVEAARIECFVDGTPGANDMPGRLTFSTTANDTATTTERMRIVNQSVGGLGHTIGDASVTGTGFNFRSQTNGAHLEIGHASGAGDGFSFVICRRAGSSIGGISQNGTTGVDFDTTSDYRLKENVTYDFDATTRLKQLQPCRFNFIAEPDRTMDGFLAHEVTDAVPQAIKGEKDAVDEDGNINPQMIDHSKLVPLLVKTIQELEARITALENAE